MNLELSLLKYVIADEDISYPEYLFTGERLELYRLFKKYYLKYDKIPNKSTVEKYVQTTQSLEDDLVSCYINIGIAKEYDKQYLKDELYDNYILRKFEKEAKIFSNSINDGKEVKSTFAKFLNELQIEDDNVEIEKGYVYESAAKRYKEYEKLESGEIEKYPSYHIKCLDKNLLGASPTSTICYVAAPGCGKTTICLNVGYNLARFENKDVLYISGELKKKQLEIILDARDSLIDSMLIRAGSLSDSLKKQYLDSLKNQWKRKDKFYIVEANPDFTIFNVVNWVRQYKKKFGKYPDILMIDYLWLMGDEAKKLDEKLGNLAKAIRHKIAKPFNLCVHYSTQESRGGLNKKSEGKERNMESIGDSNKIAPHCHAIIFLDDFKSSEDFELKNKLRLTCVKNTLGPTFKEDIWYLREYSYIGDSTLGMLDETKLIKKKKEKPKVNKQEEIEEETEFKFEDI